MPSQPPRFSFVERAPVKPWATPGKNAERRLRGRALQRDRKRVLAEEPLCRSCLEAGRCVASAEVDHIDNALPDPLWDARANKQGLCRDCHKAKTALESAAARAAARLG